MNYSSKKQSGMKIIHLVLGKANPKRMNGVNKVVHQLASTQSALGQNVSIWGIANDLEETFPERAFPTRLFQQQRNKSLPADLKAAICTLNEDSCVHMHGAFIPEFYQASRVLKKHRIPYVFTPHGSYSKKAMEKNRWVKKFYFHLLESKLLKDAKMVHLLGVNEADNLNKLQRNITQRLIPNGLDFKQIPSSFESKKEKDFTFGFLGRIDIYHKGLDLMLTGFQEFITTGGQAKLELIGDGKDRPALEQLAEKLGIAAHITFHGALFGDEKFETLHRFDTFLHTSRMEGFPMAVLEAAALSIPCITSEATNINSYIRKHEAGIALTENTPAKIAEAMHQAVAFSKSKRLEQLGANAHNMVATTFNWESIADELMKAYAA